MLSSISALVNNNLYAMYVVHFIQWGIITSFVRLMSMVCAQKYLTKRIPLKSELDENMIGGKSFAIISVCLARKSLHIAIFKHSKIYNNFMNSPSYALSFSCQSSNGDDINGIIYVIKCNEKRFLSKRFPANTKPNTHSTH